MKGNQAAADGTRRLHNSPSGDSRAQRVQPGIYKQTALAGGIYKQTALPVLPVSFPLPSLVSLPLEPKAFSFVFIVATNLCARGFLHFKIFMCTHVSTLYATHMWVPAGARGGQIPGAEVPGSCEVVSYLVWVLGTSSGSLESRKHS